MELDVAGAFLIRNLGSQFDGIRRFVDAGDIFVSKMVLAEHIGTIRFSQHWNSKNKSRLRVYQLKDERGISAADIENGIVKIDVAFDPSNDRLNNFLSAPVVPNVSVVAKVFQIPLVLLV